MHILRWGCAVLVTVFLASPAWSQTYPDKPIKIIFPVPAGSITDTMVRALSESLTKHLGQPIIIENRPGGNMTLGANACAKAPPDGYTICAVSGNVMSFNPAVMKNLSYDPAKDFKPITQMWFMAEGLLASKGSNLNSAEDLKKMAATKPSSLNFATVGVGEATDMYRRWLSKEWKHEIQGIPYKGGGDLTTALMRSEVAVALGGIGNVYGQLQSGDIKVLAVRTSKRLKSLPNVPTEAEAGLNYPGSGPWWGLAAPAGTPDEAINKLNAAFKAAVSEPQNAKFLEDRFLDVVAGSPAEFAAFMKKDRDGTAQLVKEFDVKEQDAH